MKPCVSVALLSSLAIGARALSLAAPHAAAGCSRTPVLSMGLFPSEEGAATVEPRNVRLARLLGALVGASEADAASLLDSHTELLLEPFSAGSHVSGSVFRDGMTLDDKLAEYERSLAERISAASSEPVASALTAMRDHTIAAAARLRGGEAAEELVVPRQDFVQALQLLDMGVYNNNFVSEQNSPGARGKGVQVDRETPLRHLAEAKAALDEILAFSAAVSGGTLRPSWRGRRTGTDGSRNGYPDRRWWHMLDDERWRAVAEQAGTGAGGAAADGDGDAAMDRVDGEQGARAAGDAEVAEVRPAPPPVRRGVQRSALADALEAEDDERQEEPVFKLYRYETGIW
ncbi:hypothetical protein EMIHUDRAFT_119357 [Emiliania huxleyi CCMP1516]|uniref:Uncharacterized protein n=2 Tax=Emiliania huxleyi TaxID=2903 RepID=A0A0D3IW66_EMIH1|nr:hypothetical protein EMIHUDRAFT_119357 [Emiliania huxleyi CCMP1516]EOD15501.1 hypothetical protein EMIHUDRAFT_119357 [Emiliania huxleyi CCMP1516]|eukprot:XP_005767930.1 hypothetical protein EMIHUDRAFT_119357 [Emiliania huxleyi CCMP1516]